jgi:hypothetical protein
MVGADVPLGSSKLILGNPKVKDVDFALVGFHVVGSMAGHPEMTWATFEHINNSPNLPYSYVGKSGAIITKPADAAGPWLFSSKGAETASIKPRLKLNTVTKTEVNAVSPAGPPPTVGPSDVTRLVPWGTVSAESEHGPHQQYGYDFDQCQHHGHVACRRCAQELHHDRRDLD